MKLNNYHKVNQIQVNFCKRITCPNFSVKEDQRYVAKYIDSNLPVLICLHCGDESSLIDNQKLFLTCPPPVQNKREQTRKYDFDNNNIHDKPVQNLSVHDLYGNSEKTSDSNEHTLDNNSIKREILTLLLNGNPSKVIREKFLLTSGEYYSQIVEISNSCRALLNMFNDKLATLYQNDLHLSSNVDFILPHQHNGIRWLVTGESKSGYIISQQLNLEPDNKHTIENLFVDYNDKNVNSLSLLNSTHNTVLIKVDITHRLAMCRANVENILGDTESYHISKDLNLTHFQYTAYAHYIQIAKYLKMTKELAFFIPQEPVLRAATIAAFHNRILNKAIDLIYVIEDPEYICKDNAEGMTITFVGRRKERWAFNKRYTKGISHINKEGQEEARWLEKASYNKISDYQNSFHNLLVTLIDDVTSCQPSKLIIHLLDIYCAWHNLCRQDDEGLTPAQKLSLTSIALPINELANCIHE
ncbi:hypothetical protein L4D76_14600 [Photobacterium sagamiensis]|uniref:hypothetical protein n=1 Tax=Photobacterium sagamiensis TaxID=2910241 RepID=UPI003D0F7F92